jgi:hypothetical protein
MMEEKPIKPEYGKLTQSCRVFATLNFFLILSIFILVTSNLIDLKLPKYYPIQGVWSISPKEGPAMGYYSAIGFSILFALPFSVLFYLASPHLQRYLEIRFKTFKNLTTAFVLFGIFYFVIKEWKKWGIEKMGLKSVGFFGPEFWFFLFVFILFLLILKLVLILEKKIFE